MSDRGADEGGGEENFQLVTVTNHKPEGQPHLATVSLSFHLILNEWIIQNDMKNILQAVQSQISVGGILVKPQDSKAAILKLEADVDASIETLPAVQRELGPNSSTSVPVLLVSAAQLWPWHTLVPSFPPADLQDGLFRQVFRTSSFLLSCWLLQSLCAEMVSGGDPSASTSSP